MDYDLSDKTIIITGANSGIGKAAAIQLAKLGASVVLACRSKERGERALDEVRHAANSFEIELMLVDMSSQKSIRQFAIEFNQYPLLDIEFDNLYGERKFNLQHAYYHSKQAQVMFTFDLAERLQGTGISVHCVRVGNVAIPDERLVHLPRWMLKMYELKRKFSMTPEKMAETYVWLAADPVGEQQTGGYWDAPGVEVKANAYAYNKETQKRLWAASALLTRV